MTADRVLILGANGQLGTALRAAYPQAVALDRAAADIADPAFARAFDWSRVDTVLNACGFTDVDGAETPAGRRAAWASNAVGPGHLAAAALRHGLTLVHVSSDYVFDGTVCPHVETERFSPLGVYGQAKAAGDIAVGLAPRHYILRVSWLIGPGANFVRTMGELARRDIAPSVVDDQIGRLTFTGQLVAAIDHLLTTGAAPGTYHLSNDGPAVSWAQITRAVFDELGRSDLPVTEVSTAAYTASRPAAAPRPMHSELDLTKIRATGLVLQDWRAALRDYLSPARAATLTR